MSSFLYRVGRFAARRRWTVIVIWIAVVVGASALAGVLGNHLQSSFTVPGTQAQSALDALEQRFPQISGASAKVVAAARVKGITVIHAPIMFKEDASD
ncbi:MAG TPA: hypothetical protein DCL57_04730, partial [Microbacterium sp.]|nr:hypothetical protein [Microbacterium sp.]